MRRGTILRMVSAAAMLTADEKKALAGGEAVTKGITKASALPINISLRHDGDTIWFTFQRKDGE